MVSFLCEFLGINLKKLHDLGGNIFMKSYQKYKVLLCFVGNMLSGNKANHETSLCLMHIRLRTAAFTNYFEGLEQERKRKSRSYC